MSVLNPLRQPSVLWSIYIGEKKFGGKNTYGKRKNHIGEEREGGLKN